MIWAAPFAIRRARARRAAGARRGAAQLRLRAVADREPHALRAAVRAPRGARFPGTTCSTTAPRWATWSPRTRGSRRARPHRAHHVPAAYRGSAGRGEEAPARHLAREVGGRGALRARAAPSGDPHAHPARGRLRQRPCDGDSAARAHLGRGATARRAASPGGCTSPTPTRAGSRSSRKPPTAAWLPPTRFSKGFDLAQNEGMRTLSEYQSIVERLRADQRGDSSQLSPAHRALRCAAAAGSSKSARASRRSSRSSRPHDSAGDAKRHE